MNTFYLSLLSNSPVLIALFILFHLIKQQGFKMENEFKLVRSEMREGFLKVNLRLKQHDREIKAINKKLKSLSNHIKS